jgi:hypothetical protein
MIFGTQQFCGPKQFCDPKQLSLPRFPPLFRVAVDILAHRSSLKSVLAYVFATSDWRWLFVEN